MTDKNIVIIKYLENIINGWLFKSEYSTDYKDKKVVVVTMVQGDKQVLWDGIINDYFQIQIFGTSIQEEKEAATEIGNLIGEIGEVEYNENKYTIVISQLSNPQSIMYEDIRRVGYTMTLKTIINKIGG
jgi:hypothetical protein